MFISMPAAAEWLLILVGLLILFYWIRAIYSVSLSRFENPNMKIFWLIVVVFLGILGAFIYDVAGRRTRVG